jgi:hypothetical protein
MIGVAVSALDAPTIIWFFDANTNKLVGVSEDTNSFQQYDTRCRDAASAHYTVTAGMLPTCQGTFVRDLCAPQQDAGN